MCHVDLVYIVILLNSFTLGRFLVISDQVFSFCVRVLAVEIALRWIIVIVRLAIRRQLRAHRVGIRPLGLKARHFLSR